MVVMFIPDTMDMLVTMLKRLVNVVVPVRLGQMQPDTPSHENAGDNE